MNILVLVVLFIGSALITGWGRQFGLRHSIIDVPNQRSSHTVPTPRSGGIGLVLCFLATLAIAAYKGFLAPGLGAALGGGGLLIALTGALDDRFTLSARHRIALHFLAASWAIWMLQGAPSLYLGWTTWNWGWIGNLVSVFGIVWMINLYNFMDGIDGLAGVEGACVSAGAGLLLTWQGATQPPAFLAWALTAVCAGFLVWNWPPAKVFMGDIGSGFLGFVLAVMALASAKERPWFLWPWLILLSVFLADSTFTLLRRFFGGDRWYEAHRSHAYQRAARRCGSHSKITLSIAAVNLAWLLPLASLAAILPKPAPVFALIALGPLIWAAVYFRAGVQTE